MAGYSASLGGKGKSLSRRVGKKKKKGTVTAAKKKRAAKPKTAAQIAGTNGGKQGSGIMSALKGGKGVGYGRGLAGSLMREAMKRKGRQSRKKK